MNELDTRDRLQEQFDANLPPIDIDEGWDRLAEETTPRRRRRPARPRRAVIAAAGAAVLVVAIAFVTVAALGLLDGWDRVASVDMTITKRDTTTTDDEIQVDTTSPLHGLIVTKGVEAVTQFGNAVVSYLTEGGDLATLQRLVTPSAQDGLAQMLSLLSGPTRCRVMSVGTTTAEASTETTADLLFVGGESGPVHFNVTIVADLEAETIKAITISAIEPAGSAGPAAPSTAQVEWSYHYLNPSYSYYAADAIVLGKVIEVLPVHGDPIAYKGYVLEVERAYGPSSISRQITVYALESGAVVVDGVTPEAWRQDLSLDASLGDRLFVPVTKTASFAGQELKPDEYWVQSNVAVFAVDETGICTRAAGAELDPEVGSEYSLSELEEIAVQQGQGPSLLQ